MTFKALPQVLCALWLFALCAAATTEVTSTETTVEGLSVQPPPGSLTRTPAVGTSSAVEFFQRYNDLLESHYYTMSLIQGLLLGVVGDLVGQVLESVYISKKPFAWNKTRTRTMTILALVVDGLITPAYYDYIDRVDPRKNLLTIMWKALIGSAVYGPFANGLFLAALPVIEKWSLKAFNYSEWKRQLWVVIVKDFQIWPLFELVNFYLIPKHWRPLAVNMLCVVFNAIISVTAYGHGPDDQKRKEDDDEEAGRVTRKPVTETPQQQTALRPTKARNVMLSESASLHV